MKAMPEIVAITKDQAKGIDYKSLVGELKKKGYFPNEDDKGIFKVMGTAISAYLTSGQLIAAKVSSPVYETWFNVKLEKKRRPSDLISVYFDPSMRESADNLSSMQKQYLEKMNVRKDVIPALVQARTNLEVLELLRKVGMSRTVLTEVSKATIDDFVAYSNGVRSDVDSFIEKKKKEVADFVTDCQTTLYDRFQKLMEMLDEEEKKIDESISPKTQNSQS